MTIQEIHSSAPFIEIYRKTSAMVRGWRSSAEKSQRELRKETYYHTVQEYIWSLYNGHICLTLTDKQTFKALMKMAKALSWEDYDEAREYLLEKLICDAGYGEYLNDEDDSDISYDEE